MINNKTVESKGDWWNLMEMFKNYYINEEVWNVILILGSKVVFGIDPDSLLSDFTGYMKEEK